MSSPSVPVELRAESVMVGRQRVLRDVHVRVRAGESVAVVGSNGSGKTTLLRALAGLLPVRSGTVRWQGSALPEGPARVRQVGIVLQNERAPALTVLELVTLGFGERRRATGEELAEVRRALEAAGLASLAERPCSELSGGEWQRVRLVRATLAGPHLLILDEPTNHLDPGARRALFARLAQLGGEGAALVVATHDLGLAARCERALLLANGAIAQDGPASSVLAPDKLSALFGGVKESAA